jgi:hypothetical protein
LAVVPANPRGNLVRSIWGAGEAWGSYDFGSPAWKRHQREEIPGDSGREPFFSSVWQGSAKNGSRSRGRGPAKRTLSKDSIFSLNLTLIGHLTLIGLLSRPIRTGPLVL